MSEGSKGAAATALLMMVFVVDVAGVLIPPNVIRINLSDSV